MIDVIINKEHKILHAYSDYGLSAVGSFLSRGDLQIAEYTKDVWGWKIKEQLAKEENFSIIVASDGSDLQVYQEYLDENLLSYSKSIVKGKDDTDDLYYIFSNFNFVSYVLYMYKILYYQDIVA